MKRENFQSRLGFLLVSAGCAIGIGNVWKFPYVTGENGGGVFVLFYLLFLVILGVPVLTMELAVGRASRKSAVEGYKALEPKGSKWHIHGWFCLIGCCLLMMYYTTVAGWMLDYFYKFAVGSFDGMANDAIDGVFSAMLANPAEMTVFMVIIVLAGFLVCSFGLQKGLERISKWMMLALLALIVVLAVHSLTLDGAAEGVKFYLLPDFQRAAEEGLGNVITAAMNQSFFTLSLGIAAMEIFGSYMSRDNSLTGEAVRICCLDTFVAFMSGMIIFPACFSFGVEPAQGPALIFMTLPRVFVNMAGGRVWGALFFLFMTFASFTTVLAVFENIMATCIDSFGWSRKKATVICCVFILVASMPRQHALHPGLQLLVFLRGAAQRRQRRPDPGRGGLPGQQSAAASGLSGVSAVLRHQVGLGLRQVSGRGQHRHRAEDVPGFQALFPVHRPGDHPGDFDSGPDHQTGRLSDLGTSAALYSTLVQGFTSIIDRSVQQRPAGFGWPLFSYDISFILQEQIRIPAKRLFSSGRFCAILKRNKRGLSAGYRRSPHDHSARQRCVPVRRRPTGQSRRRHPRPGPPADHGLVHPSIPQRIR